MTALVTDPIRWWGTQRSRPAGDRLRRPRTRSPTGRSTSGPTTSPPSWPTGACGPATGSGIVGPNSLEWCAGALGALKAGAIVAPYSHRLLAAELVHLVATSEPTVVLADEEHRERMEQVGGQRPRFELVSLDDVGPAAPGPRPALPPGRARPRPAGGHRVHQRHDGPAQGRDLLPPHDAELHLRMEPDGAGPPPGRAHDLRAVARRGAGPAVGDPAHAHPRRHRVPRDRLRAPQRAQAPGRRADPGDDGRARPLRADRRPARVRRGRSLLAGGHHRRRSPGTPPDARGVADQGRVAAPDLRHDRAGRLVHGQPPGGGAAPARVGRAGLDVHPAPGGAARRHRLRPRGAGRDHRPGPVGDARLLAQRGGDPAGAAGRLVPQRRRRHLRRRTATCAWSTG